MARLEIEEVHGDEEAVAKGAWAVVHALFRDASPMTCSHWNPLTGEVFKVRSSRRQAAQVEAFEERLFSEEGWVEVPFLESDDAFGLMRGFAEELAPGKGRTELLRALDGDKPFRAFRTVLKRRPGLARRWAKVADEEAAVRLVGFCLGQGLRLPHPAFDEAEAEIVAAWEAQERSEGFVQASALSLGRRR